MVRKKDVWQHDLQVLAGICFWVALCLTLTLTLNYLLYRTRVSLGKLLKRTTIYFVS